MMDRWFLYLLIFLGSMKLYDYWWTAFGYMHRQIKAAYTLADRIGKHDYDYLTPDHKVIQPDVLVEEGLNGTER